MLFRVARHTENLDEVVAFYMACGFHVTHQTEGEFGRDTWFELRLDAGRGALA